MKLNTTKLRARLASSNWDHDSTIEEQLQMLDIVEVAKRGLLLYDLCEQLRLDHPGDPREEYAKLEECREMFNELLADVEIDE